MQRIFLAMARFPSMQQTLNGHMKFSVTALVLAFDIYRKYFKNGTIGISHDK